MPVSEPLPILRLLGHALRDVLGNLGGLARIAWPYYLLAAVCMMGAYALGTGSAVAELLAPLLGPGMAALIAGLAVLACTVKWQRHAILGEPLRGTAPLNGRVACYAFWSLALTLLCGVPFFCAGALGLATQLISWDHHAAPPFAAGPPGLALVGAGALLAFFLMARLSAFLPGVSVDDRSLGLRHTWQLSRGQGLRLLALFVLLTLAAGLVGAARWLLDALVSDGGGAMAETFTTAAKMLMDLLSGVFGGRVTAGIYRHLVSVPAGAS